MASNWLQVAGARIARDPSAIFYGVLTTVPTVSIIMPCYNAGHHLPKSVGSVLAQSFPDWELIVVDDGSSDESFQWLQSRSDPRIKVFRQVNAGSSAARNRGLGIAQGTYIAFLDADDTWETSFLARMVGALQERPDAVLAYCGWQNLGLPTGDGERFVPPDYECPGKLEVLFASCRWPIHGALTRREAIVRAGGFSLDLHNAEDYLLWLQVAIDAPIVRVPEVLAYYHFHDPAQQMSRATPARAALAHANAQRRYLATHREVARTLGRRAVRKHIVGQLLRKGYECYWRRDLSAARILFRHVMCAGYGGLGDWKYMLPAWLPERWHEWLLRRVDASTTRLRP